MVYFLKDLLEVISKIFTEFFNSIFSILKVLVLSKFFTKLPRADQKICFILGNGPSLKSSFLEDEELFQKASLFCVNGFANSPEFVKYKPKNCLFLDPLFYIKDAKDLKPHIIECLDNIVKHTTWNLNLFLPQFAKQAKYLNRLSEENPFIKISYFNYTVVKGYKPLSNFLFKKNLGMPLCQNVLGACLMISLNMGFEKIFLFGADHNLGKNVFVNDSNEVCMIHNHFYQDGKPPLITNAFRKPGGGEKLNIAGFYMLCVKTFLTYYPIEKYAKYLKRKIYNATTDSFIDAFERIKIDEIKKNL